ncbi:hypothetical protein PF005_g4908 [Phytophthora fragariae]|uniref:Uncharacterized protein n=1 Tax=Phytophthora fragariae TaxID=53985 RepID=A0A6A3UHG9_9STRA|nr:hypothetical protein PF003_g18692 [Phytophthora fragariae]KAE8944925.1 hypothetical protein PF009_g5401 [Phytophthora fragariae]KAE9022289.1 hypothetical protein PF011_g4538 [Phytophthora fragariae]KAE9129098.1 hypothetical protein PF010_g4262 [Phytophthora fragariae]KAE9129333.1 hypothetical protein PF007_g4916 [Phytophthora fragariae]
MTRGALREKVSRFRGELLPDILPLCVTEAKAEVNNKVVQSMGSTLVKRLREDSPGIEVNCHFGPRTIMDIPQFQIGRSMVAFT